MRPLTLTTPKPMLQVGGKPLLHHIFDTLPEEVTEVILVVGYLGEQIKSYFGDQFGRLKVTYLEQPGKLGTAHALGLARKALAGERFLMLYADDLQSKADIAECVKYPLAILVKEVEDPRRFGVVVTDESGYITKLVEKPENPPSNLVSIGVMVLDDRIFNYPAPQQENGEQYLTDSLAAMAKDYQVKVVPASFWLPVGYPEDLQKAEAWLNTAKVSA